MYNSNIHHRRSIRLRNFNYANIGAYFVTVCLNQRIPEDSAENTIFNSTTFGKIENDTIILNEYGKIASNEWIHLSKRYPNISFDIFQIMPDHIHGIIQIHNAPAKNTNNIPSVGATLAVAQNASATRQNPNTTNQNTNAPTPDIHPQLADDIPKNRATARVAPTVTIGRIIGAYKSLVSVKCLEISKQKNHVLGKLWQRNYYEHIIRNETEYSNIVKYIYDNPVLWGKSGQLDFNLYWGK